MTTGPLGQVHKGGPDEGLFLVITTDEPEDLEIPGREFGFATLHRAQALGDMRALRDVHRRTLHVHLKDDPATALDHLARALEARATEAALEAR